MFSSYTPGGAFTKSFQLVQNAFLQSPGLPFADVLPEEQIQEAFAAAGADFARDEGDTYTPAVTLWGWLSQTLHAGPMRSCGAAVARVVVLCVMLNREPPSPDTGTYCRARAKLPEAVLERLVYGVGDALEARVPADWLWQGRHVKIGDGTTLSTPDTPANQHAWPQSRSQKPGVGFPILRLVVLLSLATAALCGVAIGPYQGKQTGEPALLRELLDRFQAGDVFLGDCCFAAYLMLALLLGRGVDSVVRQHQRRRTDFRCGQRLGRRDHVVLWQRPARPEWMDEETYRGIPPTISVRELEVRVEVRGFLRSIKTTLYMDDLRCKTPEMVRREILVHWLSYNLIRKVMAQAALHQQRLPRELSFAAAIAAIGSAWGQASVANRKTLTVLAETQWRLIAWHEVGHRPNRVEPRAIKRRPKEHKLLRKPRQEARADLLHTRAKRR
jgi:putative transposase